MIQPTTAISTKVFKEDGYTFTNEFGFAKTIYSYEDIIQKLTRQVNQWASGKTIDIIAVSYDSKKQYCEDMNNMNSIATRKPMELNEIVQHVYCTVVYKTLA